MGKKKNGKTKRAFNALAILDAKDQQLQDQIKEINGERKANAKELRQALSMDDKYKKTDYFVEAIEIPNFSGKQAELEKIAEAISNLS